jgi:N utilization substance protein A
MIELFKQEVPEVYDGIVEIKGVARMPGSRAKVAVYATDSNIDPVGACVGVRGVRIQAISSELHGEKIDVIHYSSDLATYMVNALTPAEVVKVIIDDDGKKIEVAVPDSKLNIAIGRRGQNVSLVSELVGWRISIIGEEVESARRTEEFELGTELFVKALNVEETIAQLLVTEGFVSISDIAGSSIAEIANIEGFNNEIASEIKDRAIKYLESPTSETQESLCKTGISENLAKIPGIGLDLLVKLGKTDIKARKDLAELSTDEFTDLISDSGLSKEQIDKIIIHAREQEGWLDG